MEPLRRKPMVRAKTVSLFHRVVRTKLSSAAVEILLGQAQILSEGQMDADAFFGSTMITIQCQQAKEWVSDPCDAATSKQVGELLLADDLFRQRSQRLGERAALRLAKQPLSEMQIELSLRTSGDELHVDVDIEAQAGLQRKVS